MICRGMWLAVLLILIVVVPSNAMHDGATGSSRALSSPLGSTPSEPGHATPVASPIVSATALPEIEGNIVIVSLQDLVINMPDQLPAGLTTFRITNDGQIPHNFKLQGPGRRVALAAALQPGQMATLRGGLQPGVYDVYCPIGNHAEQGMRLLLTVTE